MFSYIGICDFPNGEMAQRTARTFDSICSFYGLNNYKLMVGAMMSYNTMTGQPSRYTKVWAHKTQVANIFISDPIVFNCLHYADYDGHSKSYHLIEAVTCGGANLHAIQLDMVWPKVQSLETLLTRYPQLKFILQINTPAMHQVGNDPLKLVSKLNEYGSLLDYILLDRSMGTGESLKKDELMPYIKAIKDNFSFGVAIAGGLGPTTMYLAEPFTHAYPSISLDMQSGVRPSGNITDPIEENMVESALYEAIRLIAKSQRKY